MAVTTTPEDVILAAYAKSKKNVSGQIASQEGELLALVGRALRGLFAFGARINPMAFATSTTQAGASGAWTWPDDVESWIRLEDNADDSEVVVVGFDQRTAEPGKPAVYYAGRSWYPAGNAGDPDPASDTLKYWYAKRADLPTTTAEALDALWIESFNELLVLEVAIYLAMKDERSEVAVLRADRDRWLAQYIAHLEHVVPMERRTRAHVRTINTNTLVPLTDLVAGGTSLEVAA